MNNAPFVIAIDWGTSSFRAWLLDACGRLLDSVSCPLGILNVLNDDFAAVLDEACSEWLGRWPHIPIVMCGMIGSRQGWKEARYLSGAVGADELAAALTAVDYRGHDTMIVPGLAGKAFGGGNDLMRGEETIMSGAFALGAPETALFCLPGTHSKWIAAANGKIETFSTFFTGELFSMLCERSSLSPLIGEGPEKSRQDPDASFFGGMDMAGTGQGLLHQLFAVRANVLTGVAQSWETCEILSGLLIGNELAAMEEFLRSARRQPVIVSSGKIGIQYEKALKKLGFSPRLVKADEACRAGLFAIASRHVSGQD